MFNPDIHDPEWQKQRAAQWESLSKPLKKDFTRKQMAVLKGWFMGEPYEYANYEKYGDALACSWTWPMVLHPIQTPTFWKKLLLEDLKKWHGPRYVLEHGLSHLSGLQAEDRSEVGWGFETSLEAAAYSLGERFVTGPYEFEGIACRYPFSVGNMISGWNFGASQWLAGVAQNDDSVIAHYFEHWRQAMALAHPAYFDFVASRKVWQTQLFLHGFMRRVQNYKCHVEEAAQEYKLSELGLNNRLRLGSQLKTYFESPDCPEKIQKLYEFSIDPHYQQPNPYVFMPEEFDITAAELKNGN